MDKNQKQDYQRFKFYSTTCGLSIGILLLSFIISIVLVDKFKINISETGLGILLSIIFTTSVISIIASHQANYFLKHSHGFRRQTNFANKSVVDPLAKSTRQFHD